MSGGNLMNHKQLRPQVDCQINQQVPERQLILTLTVQRTELNKVMSSD